MLITNNIEHPRAADDPQLPIMSAAAHHPRRRPRLEVERLGFLRDVVESRARAKMGPTFSLIPAPAALEA